MVDASQAPRTCAALRRRHLHGLRVHDHDLILDDFTRQHFLEHARRTADTPQRVKRPVRHARHERRHARRVLPLGVHAIECSIVVRHQPDARPQRARGSLLDAERALDYALDLR